MAACHGGLRPLTFRSITAFSLVRVRGVVCPFWGMEGRSGCVYRERVPGFPGSCGGGAFLAATRGASQKIWRQAMRSTIRLGDRRERGSRRLVSVLVGALVGSLALVCAGASSGATGYD